MTVSSAWGSDGEQCAREEKHTGVASDADAPPLAVARHRVMILRVQDAAANGPGVDVLKAPAELDNVTVLVCRRCRHLEHCLLRQSWRDEEKVFSEVGRARQGQAARDMEQCSSSRSSLRASSFSLTHSFPAPRTSPGPSP